MIKKYVTNGISVLLAIIISSNLINADGSGTGEVTGTGSISSTGSVSGTGSEVAGTGSTMTGSVMTGSVVSEDTSLDLAQEQDANPSLSMSLTYVPKEVEVTVDNFKNPTKEDKNKKVEMNLGDKFTVDVFLNTNENEVIGLRSQIKYDIKSLKVLDIDYTKSVVDTWAEHKFNNGRGEIDLLAGFLGGHSSNKDQVITTIEFEIIGDEAYTGSLVFTPDNNDVRKNNGEVDSLDVDLNNIEYYITSPDWELAKKEKQLLEKMAASKSKQDDQGEEGGELVVKVSNYFDEKEGVKEELHSSSSGEVTEGSTEDLEPSSSGATISEDNTSAIEESKPEQKKEKIEEEDAIKIEEKAVTPKIKTQVKKVAKRQDPIKIVNNSGSFLSSITPKKIIGVVCIVAGIIYVVIFFRRRSAQAWQRSLEQAAESNSKKKI